MRRILKFISILFLVAIAILSYVIFHQADYNVGEYAVKPGTKYWSLASGSHIGYTFLPATTSKQPYPVLQREIYNHCNH